jgi:hypothetical protein
LAKRAPMPTFSIVVISGNDCTVWLVFVMPFEQILYGGNLEMSSFMNRILPESGLYTPLMRLRRVDFPEPFGPTSPAMVPSLTVRSAFLSAWSPPNAFDTFKQFSNIAVSDFELKCCGCEDINIH